MPSERLLRIAVAAQCAEAMPHAQALAHQLNLPIQFPSSNEADLILVHTRERLELKRTAPGAPGSIYADFAGGKCAHRRKYGGGCREPLARVMGLGKIRNPTVLDATAGLGRDAFVLATLGCRVSLIERSPIIAALLADALVRAEQDPPTYEIVKRMNLVHSDAIDYMRRLLPADCPDVVYLDPMYPRSRKSAKVKKEMQILRYLLGEKGNNEELLPTALSCTKHRVVVKRPRSAPALNGPPPSTSMRASKTRYDIYLPKILA